MRLGPNIHLMKPIEELGNELRISLLWKRNKNARKCKQIFKAHR